ncbi:Uncharacterized conserved protein UCP016719 [Pseudopedobacter saltans DSM 12145]|uniref:Uncharacterized conserved protein UCP016719 n=1 Tax=Pseudopedobacter saltans (strain ATCC 51119 / DSM 12145 / JCM 21818 / CCUG 39354 / LMG 10337 / NBRC 100064 / NCIMB 13643) TaxID=762903 RepID=F0SB31_PSESL|nr:DUF1343 domain-containing protein [Pseudopedobacter saltans]ADY52666.1 Uncharacterized conserved protein UCP016719 [Pseudopedobacter saltans DSM 12145]
MKKSLYLSLIISCISFSCQSSTTRNKNQQKSVIPVEQPAKKILTGADQTEKYLPLLKGKKVGLVVNQTAQINGISLVDTLQARGVDIRAIFGPEHGFRGDADAGEKVGNYIDKKSGLPVISLYGKKHAPSKEDLKGIDILIFDIQDVGVRFYTYTITMAYVMQACADNNIPMMILDRPNPNGLLIDGPILDPKFKSGVGMHQIPIGHGLTIAEFAQMVNGENWLENKKKCELQIIKLANYAHGMRYSLPVKPSPNLPNELSIYLYPSLCMFEGTAISQGRGTTYPFQVLGHPLLKGKYQFHFTPVSIQGMSKQPPLENQICYGIDFRETDIEKTRKQDKLNIKIILDLYKAFPEKEKFFTPFFNKLAGNDILMQQIIDGKTEEEIRKSWESDLKKYKETRNKYLLYN